MRTLKRISIVLTTVVALISSGGVALAKECTAFGCHAGQGNPIEEMAGMIVLCVLVSGLLFGAARRYVK